MGKMVQNGINAHVSFRIDWQLMTSKYSQMDNAFSVGTLHSEDKSFEVISAEWVNEISGYAYIFKHVPTGARLMWFACDDDNRSFAIAFKTPPVDHTGVFHILEHSVLCGSDAYPVKEPFVNLLKTSMQTFLNAMTYPDKTVYPVASTNVADLENLISVYLDAVLHPAIYKRKRIFEQEGWHLEADEQGNLSYNGVVFNEMKGALSDPDRVLYDSVSEALFPDTAYGKESGGKPRAIPELTYENFLDTHARHYDLSNSYTFLYGDLDCERELSFIAQRFAAAEKRDAGAPNPLNLQASVLPEPCQVRMNTTADNSSVGLGYVLGTPDQRNKMMAADILFDTLMGSNESPLKRAILDAELGDDFSYYLSDDLAQPMLFLQLKGLKEDAAQKFRELVETTCKKIASEGIDPKKLNASIALAEFNLRENDQPYSNGIEYTLRSLSSWLYDDARPLDYIRYEDAIAYVKELAAQKGFEKLLLELICNSKHAAQVELVPTDEGEAQEEAAELAQLRSTLTDEDVEKIRAEVEALRLEQETPDAPEDLAKLPSLSLSDIGAGRERPAGFEVEAPLPCIAHELDTHGIDYVYHYFDLTHAVTFEELPLVGILAEALGKLDTAAHTASELDILIESNLGHLSFFTDIYDCDTLDQARPAFIVAASALAEKTQGLASIPSEVWSSTRFDDLGRLKNILIQRRIAQEQYFVGAGHTAAQNKALTSYSAASRVNDALAGVGFYEYLKNLLANWDERAPQLAKDLDALTRKMFRADNVTVSFTGSAQSRESFWQAAGDLGLTNGNKSQADNATPTLVVPEGKLQHVAYIIPSNVSYVGLSYPNVAHATNEQQGNWLIATRVLGLDYLWNEVRVKGGAYGVMFRNSIAGLQSFVSYRDPALDATLDRYVDAGSWLSEWTPDADEFEGYVVASVAGVDAPVPARMLARRQDIEYFNHRDPERLLKLREKILHAQVEDIKELGSTMPQSYDDLSVVVFGAKEAIEASKLDLEVVDLFSGQEN